MQQVERGKLSLDDDISKFIPEFPLQGHHVTVRQLLNPRRESWTTTTWAIPLKPPAASLKRWMK